MAKGREKLYAVALDRRGGKEGRPSKSRSRDIRSAQRERKKSCLGSLG